MESSPNEVSSSLNASNSPDISKDPQQEKTSLNDAAAPTSTTNSSAQNEEEENSEFESKKRQKNVCGVVRV